MKLTDWIQAISAVAIALLTLVLAWLTKKYADANVRMAQAIERDFAERYRPSPEVDCDVQHRDDWIYSVEAAVLNKGMSPLRVDAVVVAIGQKELYRQDNMILSPGEARGLASVRFSLHDLALEHLEEGHPVTVDFTVTYREVDGTVKQIVRHPMLEYRARPIGRR